MKQKTIQMYSYQELKDVSTGLAGKAIQKVRTADWWVEKVLRKYLSETINRLVGREELFNTPKVEHQIFIGDDYFPDDVIVFSAEIPTNWLNMKKYYNRWAMKNLSKEGKIPQDKLITDGNPMDRFIINSNYQFKLVFESDRVKLIIDDNTVKRLAETTLNAQAKATTGKGQPTKFSNVFNTGVEMYGEVSIPRKDKSSSNIVYGCNQADPQSVIDWFSWLEEFFTEHVKEFILNMGVVLKQSAYLVYSDRFVEEFCSLNEIYFTEDGEIEEYNFDKNIPENTLETIEIVPSKKEVSEDEGFASCAGGQKPGEQAPFPLPTAGLIETLVKKNLYCFEKRMQLLENSFKILVQELGGISIELKELPKIIQSGENSTEKRVLTKVEASLEGVIKKVINETLKKDGDEEDEEIL